jgi:hypothetical protein
MPLEKKQTEQPLRTKGLSRRPPKIGTCIRMKPARRKSPECFPTRRVDGRTPETLRHPPAPIAFDGRWIEYACYRIRNTEDDRAALVMTAGYLRDLLDFLGETKQSPNRGDDYSQVCDQFIESTSFSDCGDDTLAVFCWFTAQIILEAYEDCHRMNAWELHEHLESVLAPWLEFQESRDGERLFFSEVFSGCLWLLHGWIADQRFSGGSQTRNRQFLR